MSIAAPRDRDLWESFVNARGDAAGYHAWDWQRVFTRAFGHECVYLMARSGARVEGILPLVQIKSLIFGNTLTSLPFLNYGGVMADTTDAAEALVQTAGEEARRRRCGHVELRHVEPQFPALPCKRHKVSMRLGLGDNLWDGLDRKVRNQIRKAEKSGLVVERGGEELVGDFYTVFARNMRDLGTPVYSRRLFEEVLRSVSGPLATAHRAAESRAGGRRLHLSHRPDGAAAVGVVDPRIQFAVSERAAVLGCHSVRAFDGRAAVRHGPLDARRGHVQVQGAMGRGTRAAALGIPAAGAGRDAECQPGESEIPAGHRALAEAARCRSPRASVR